MGAIAKGLGLGTEFPFHDKVYRFSPWDYKIQGLFETYLEKEALTAVQRLRPLLGPDEYREARDKAISDVAAGVYTFGTETVAKSLQSLKHLKQLLLLMLQTNHPDATAELVDAMCKEKLDEVMQAMTLANGVEDPNAQAPAPTGAA